MEYTVNKLAKISGVSARTLHYYDEIGLLRPMRIAENGYRIYGPKEVDLLQQILFYRELGVPLKKIGQMLYTPGYDRKKELEEQLCALMQRKNQIELLIHNVEKTISAMKGETVMSDIEKFEGFKRKMIADNEAAYGKEIRERYGDELIDASNEKVKNMTEEQWEEAQALSEQINETLKEAFGQGDPASEMAQKACDLHRKWLCMFWKEGTYSKEAHKALAEGYATDERFTAYYDKIAEGCTKFLRDAIVIYCNKDETDY